MKLALSERGGGGPLSALWGRHRVPPRTGGLSVREWVGDRAPCVQWADLYLIELGR